MASTKGKSRGNNKTNTNKKSGRGKSVNQNNQLRDDCIILLSIAVAIILILSNMNLCGNFGKTIKWFMFGLLGVVQYIFPMLLAFSIVFIVINKEYRSVAKIKTIAAYVCLILFSGLCQRIYNKPDIYDSNVFEVFTKCADNSSGGGFIGGLLCKMLSPLGAVGTTVILLIFIIICAVVITEKSFINGLKSAGDSGKRIVKEAKQDYSVYKEHSAVKRSEEEQRRKEKRQKYEEKQKAREEYLANARMNKVVRGVTSDTIIQEEPVANQDIDIKEIFVDHTRDDEYSADIYEPGKAYGMYSDDKNDYEKTFDNVEDESMAEEVFEDMYESADMQDTPSYNESYNKTSSYNGAASHDEASHNDNTDAESEAVNISQEIKKPKKAYKFPPINLLKKNPGGSASGKAEFRATAHRLEETLLTFGVKVTITDISCGPTVTRYELQPEQGVKVSKIVSLSDDIKLNLAAADIRIEAPIPGKAAIGIEVPNKEAGSVYLRDLIESKEFKESPSNVSFGAGKDIAGKTIVADIAKMPHMLIAGATGSGKSVCINTIIMSILYKAKPEDVRMIMVDPKVVELSVYNGIPHLLLPVVTDPKKAAGALNWAVMEMTDRYKKFEQLRVRNLKGYNEMADKKNAEGLEPPMEKLPQIVIIIDELADLMMVAPGEVEDAICRLAQLARAAGIHMILATQRPSVNVVTGLIKANIPSKIAFAVSNGTDSRVILDMNGAEKLLGKGDMLYFPSNYPKPLRVQGAFVSDEEVEKVVDFLKNNAGEVSYDDSIANTAVSSVGSSTLAANNDERDSLFEEAGRFVISSEKGSIGSLQRHFKIGFNRAGRIMDQLAEAKVVGPELGTKPRKIEMTMEQFEELFNR